MSGLFPGPARAAAAQLQGSAPKCDAVRGKRTRLRSAAAGSSSAVEHNGTKDASNIIVIVAPPAFPGLFGMIGPKG
jgi:hypothetical protein